MSFTPRPYDAIVRDLLTTLTGGTVRERVAVPAAGPVVLDRLAQRPFRRVSHVEGLVEIQRSHVDDDGIERVVREEVPHRFTPADYALVSADGGEGADAIRFRDEAPRPVPGSELTVNYHPVQTGPVPLTDINVGSVVRTLLESVGRELAQMELELDHVYRSAFLDTATGSALDQVVALVGVRRLPAGVPIVDVRFGRDPGSPGRVTVPAGTVVSSPAGDRYATVVDLVLEAGETSRQVRCAGADAGTTPVDAGQLDRPEVLVAGIASVRNDQPAHRAAAPELDDELRRRARHALRAVARGTVAALEFGLRSLPGVKGVSIEEAPNGVPGEVRVAVAWDQPPDAVAVRHLERRIEELRPAGIRVLREEATQRRIRLEVDLVIAGPGAEPTELTQIQQGVAARVLEHLRGVVPGGKVRGTQLLRTVMDDARLVDAAVRVLADAGGGPVTDLQLEPGEVLDVVTPVTFGTISSERGADAAPVTSHVDAHLPVHLAAGVTATEATEAIRVALESHLADRGLTRPLTLDGVSAAIRDESRFALARTDAVLTVEDADRFVQLVDGAGSHLPAETEALRLRTLDVQVREGGV